jgi:hypothetical protein
MEAIMMRPDWYWADVPARKGNGAQKDTLRAKGMLPASEFWAGIPELEHLFAKPKKQPQPKVMREVVEGGCVVLRLDFPAGRKGKRAKRAEP